MTLSAQESTPRYPEMGQRIAAARNVTGMNQQAFAQVMGVTQPTVSQWEAGKTAPRTPYEWINLANALKVDLDWIIRGDPKFSYAPGWHDAIWLARGRVVAALDALDKERP